jgi:sec-independent protein translocase protein TatB
MLDFGFSEILLTSAIALVVLGPERLPKVARQVGNWMGRARSMARQLSEQLEREVSADELLKEQTRTAKSPVPDRIAPPPIAAMAQPIAPPPTEQPPAASAPYAPQAAAPEAQSKAASAALHPYVPEGTGPAYAPPVAASPDMREPAQSFASHGAPGAPTSNPPNE